MKMEDVTARLRKIEAKAVERDNEICHIMEDNLFWDFVTAIADADCEDDVRQMADEVLKSGDIDFVRYCY
jgi:hypothetical protein